MTLNIEKTLKEINNNDIVYSVSEYLDILNNSLKLMEATVQGEIGKVDIREKAVYFNLVDKADKSVINCLMWKSYLLNLGFELKEGLEVKIIGYPDIYKPIGKLSFISKYLVPVGEGALKEAYEKLKIRLEKEGYFDIGRKRAVPEFVSNIGLITSEGGAAIIDFMTHLGKHGFDIKFIDVRVEGLKAVENITAAIKWFNENAENIDVIVITRGGGSLESLQAFNSYEIAKAIYGSKIPILTAVGHEQDYTIADYVADIRGSSPTHAGKLLSQSWDMAPLRINNIQKNIYTIYKNNLKNIDTMLGYFTTNFSSNFNKRILYMKNEITKYQGRNYERANFMINKIRQIEKDFYYNFRIYNNKILNLQKELSDKNSKISNNSILWFRRILNLINNTEKFLKSSDPRLKLKQGYSIVKSKNGAIINSTDQLNINDIIDIDLYKGQIKSLVKGIRKKE